MTELDELRQLLTDRDERAAAALEDVLAFEVNEWVTVFDDEKGADGSRLVLAYLLDEGEVARDMAQAGFEFHAGSGRPGFVTMYDGGESRTVYEPIGGDGRVPLVHYRLFEGPFPSVVDLAEDFRLFWDLYPEPSTGRFVLLDDVGDTVVVAEQADSTLRVRKSFLRRHQAARQLGLCLQIVVDRWGGDELAEFISTNIDVAGDNLRFAYHGGHIGTSDRPCFTRLLGKRLLPPPPIEQSGVYPFEEEPQYLNFIIGTDADGRPVEHSCNPDLLANYFGANPDAPHFLTPVFFTRSVLDKYYANPDRYHVEDGYLRADGAWGLRMDNALDEHVVVFLGDLGGDLPEREQQYWRAFNVPPAGTMSETGFRRSFLGQWVDTDRVEHQFIDTYAAASAAFESQYGFPLFKPLHTGDAHLLHSLHVPANASFNAFDSELTGLAKLVVDSLNEEGLSAHLDKVGSEKGIGKLERFLDAQRLGGLEICSTLRSVQGARSRSAAHRKGRDFDLALLFDGSDDLPGVMKRYLEDLVRDLGALRDALCDG